MKTRIASRIATVTALGVAAMSTGEAMAEHYGGFSTVSSYQVGYGPRVGHVQRVQYGPSCGTYTKSYYVQPVRERVIVNRPYYRNRYYARPHGHFGRHHGNRHYFRQHHKGHYYRPQRYRHYRRHGHRSHHRHGGFGFGLHLGRGHGGRHGGVSFHWD
ncbi:MAG: hypothetical protein ACYTHJ_19970 [Planctomycetota bacterium]|jgi:hypothetical protein